MCAHRCPSAKGVDDHAHIGACRRYYDRIFPVNLMCRWLSYGTMNEEAAGQNLLHRRELSFTTGDDVYIRYLSYDDAAAFKKVACSTRWARVPRPMALRAHDTRRAHAAEHEGRAHRQCQMTPHRSCLLCRTSWRSSRSR